MLSWIKIGAAFDTHVRPWAKRYPSRELAMDAISAFPATGRGRSYRIVPEDDV